MTQKLRKSQLFETNLDLDHQFPYHLSTLAVQHLYWFRYSRIWHALPVAFWYSYSQTASFPFNCPSFLLDRISTNLAYPSTIRLLVGFCYSYSRTASFPLKCRSSLLPQISTDLASIAVLAFWSISVTHIHKENRFHWTVDQFRSSIRIRDIRAVLVVGSVSIPFDLQKTLSLLKCRSSLPVQISRSPAFPSSVSLLVSFCFFFPQRASFILNYSLCLPVQISKKPGYSSSESFLSISVAFIQEKYCFHLTVIHLYQFMCLERLGTGAVIDFKKVSATFKHKEHRLQSIVVHLYQFRYLYWRSRHSRAVLAFWWNWEL